MSQCPILCVHIKYFGKFSSNSEVKAKQFPKPNGQADKLMVIDIIWADIFASFNRRQRGRPVAQSWINNKESSAKT